MRIEILIQDFQRNAV